MRNTTKGLVLILSLTPIILSNGCANLPKRNQYREKLDLALEVQETNIPKEKSFYQKIRKELGFFSGKPYTTEEAILFGTCIAAQGADYYSTKRNIKMGFEESNPILGKNPSDKTLISFKIGIPLGSYVTGEHYPKYRKKIYGTCTALGTIPAILNFLKSR